MKRREHNSPAHNAKAIDGQFRNDINEKGNYRTCRISGTEVRVWGADGSRALSRDVINPLRDIIRRVRPLLPIALMADHHPAEIGVVGSVVVSNERIVPDIIGSDCGCGVYAASTGMTTHDLAAVDLRGLYEKILKNIPVGSAQNVQVRSHLRDLPLWNHLRSIPLISANILRKLRHQLASLGGGNHFVELAVDDQDSIWLLIHAGSRYLGGILYAHYQGRTIPIASDAAQQFFDIQEAIIEFARTSRYEMARRVMECIEGIAHLGGTRLYREIDLGHNYIELKNESGNVVAVHRKGACSAAAGQRGIIPGSMGTGSYIVEGTGSPESYSSSSHGAGRVFSRGEAFRKLSMRDLVRDMQGITWSESDRLKDEAPRAYKDIDTVIRAQRHLIRVRYRLKPILSIKGEERR